MPNIDASFAIERRKALLHIALTLALGVAIVGGIVWLALLERDRWRAFVIDNDCKKVAVVKGGINASPTVGIGAIPGQSGMGTVVGTAITVDEDKVAWRCRDGVIYGGDCSGRDTVSSGRSTRAPEGGGAAALDGFAIRRITALLPCGLVWHQFDGDLVPEQADLVHLTATVACRTRVSLLTRRRSAALWQPQGSS